MGQYSPVKVLAPQEKQQAKWSSQQAWSDTQKPSPTHRTKEQIKISTPPLVESSASPPASLDLGLPLYFESDRIQVRGLVIHEICREPFHWAQNRPLDQVVTERG